MSYTNGLDKPDDYFNTKLYTGNGTDAHAITGVGFSPDFVWLKGRSVAEHHTLNDTVRGANKQLFSNLIYGESTETDRLQSFDSDGFTLGTDVIVNQSSQTFVSWNWKANGSGSSNTDGDITSTVSASTTSGFSIVSYTGNNTAGATVGHGLGAEPDLIIIKNRDSAVNWQTYHKVLGNEAYMRLNTTGAVSTGASIWNNTSPTSLVFTLGSGFDAVNESGSNHIAYCFAEKKGFSKFGSYTGNGSTDGTFVYTGFRPAWVLIKPSSAVGSWYLFDSTRNAYNVTNSRIKVDGSDAESSNIDTLDITSNGFKLRDTNAAWNGSVTTYIYMCFAENPLVSSAGVPCTAR